MARVFKKSPLKSTKLVRRKRNIVIFKLSLVFIVIVAILAGMSWLSRLPVFRITDIIVRGNSGVHADDLKQVAVDSISGNYLYLLSRANKLLYPKDALLAGVLTSSERIENASINIENGHTLVVTITEREPEAIWCTGDGVEKSEDCYLIDDDGYIFAHAPRFSGNAYFIYYGGNVESPIIGKQYVPADSFTAISAFVEEVHQFGLESHALAVFDDTYTLRLNSGGKILFKGDQDFALVASTLRAISQKTDVFKEGSLLEYVDVRFGNKVYYKKIGDNADQQLE